MLKTKQIIVIVVVVALIGVLLAQPLSGLVDKGETTSNQGGATPESIYNLELVSEMYKQGLSPSVLQGITDLEARLVQAKEEDDKLAVYEELAVKWDDVAKPIPQGFIYKEMAEITPKFEYWLKAGDAFRAGYTNLQDTALAAALNSYAISSYEEAVALDPSSLAAKTGLGASLVTGAPNNPMAGIALLQEVVAAEPKNVDANMVLGVFSMQSQQFDKAIERFSTVVEAKPDPEAYFYLAAAYVKIGLKDEAIAAYQRSKELAADPSLSQYIDRQIEELRK